MSEEVTIYITDDTGVAACMAAIQKQPNSAIHVFNVDRCEQMMHRYGLMTENFSEDALENLGDNEQEDTNTMSKNYRAERWRRRRRATNIVLQSVQRACPAGEHRKSKIFCALGRGKRENWSVSRHLRPLVPNATIAQINSEYPEIPDACRRGVTSMFM